MCQLRRRGIQTGQANNNTGFPTGGFPVINYEPTGLTLKFTPQVFPNLDVQVKMSIESKDVLGASTLTPTFTERTITGTARVQNNRTMMLASVSQDVQTNGRRGLPILGLVPILGRLFTSPTRDNRQVDIVIAVTPRVLRAPAVTPRDEEMRPSGTLQSPTTGSLEALIREADHDDQLAAARRLPRNANVVLPDREPEPFSPAKTEDLARNNQPNTQTVAATPTITNTVATNTSGAGPRQATPVPSLVKTQSPAEELPAFVPAPKSMVSSQSAAALAAVNTSDAGIANATLTSLPRPIETAVTSVSRRTRLAQLSLAPTNEVLKIGEKRRLAIALNTDVPLGLAVLALHFDPNVVRIQAVSPGNLFSPGNMPSLTQSIDQSGVCLVSISSLSGASALKGAGALIYIDIEGVAAGDAGLLFDKDTMHFVGVDAHDVTLDLIQGHTTVKQ